MCMNIVIMNMVLFYGFKHLTYVPFDLNLIDKQYLSQTDIDIINNHHKQCLERYESI